MIRSFDFYLKGYRQPPKDFFKRKKHDYIVIFKLFLQILAY